ncbi:PPE domain-containing protein [Mycolicibacterium tusciae]|uniref:PPE domain-containing protein n=1 Tax=Mycolicibacterium tusciae TaxID=75922 RepID=UPI00024A4BE7|nr:PPE domain-containing protein [Mycolicibacterium tusciae]
MVSVDPSGLVSAAQRITSALSELSAANPEHPPLAADPASVGAAGRLTTAGTTLAGVLMEQAAGLAVTAEQLANVAAGFVAKDAANATKISSLNTGSEGASVSGWAPPSPPVPPDARPILAAPPAAPAEIISNAVHSGDSASGETFISGWRQVASSARDASSAVRLVADNLPDSWDSPVATDVVRGHLIKYADAFETSGQRADTVAEQANRHAQEVTQARSDIPSPKAFQAMNHQLQTLAQANADTGGMYAVPLANAVAQKTQMEEQTTQGFGGYYASTEATTAGEIDLDGDGIPDISADEAAAAAGEGTGLPGEAKPGEPGSSDMAGQLSSMLPSMIPTVLGAAGGLMGGAMSSVMKAPEALIQAGTQAMGAATQSLSGLMQPELDDIGTEDLGLDDAPLDDMSGFGGGGGGGGMTSPASGGAPSTPPVMPSTGPNPTPPTLPTGGSLPPPVSPTMGPGGSMPMGGMPMGGMPMGGAGQGGAADDRNGKPKQVVGKDRPHTESVTGKVTADRIAVSSTAPDRKDDDPPSNDDSPQRGSAPVIRRITTVAPKDGP